MVLFQIILQDRFYFGAKAFIYTFLVSFLDRYIGSSWAKTARTLAILEAYLLPLLHLLIRIVEVGEVYALIIMSHNRDK